MGTGFQEGKNMGLADSQALSYTLLHSFIGSGLSVFSLPGKS